MADLSQVVRERSGGAALWGGLVKVVHATVVPAHRDIKEELSDAAKYSPLRQGALDFALFPHARCPQHAEFAGILNRALAWDWVASEIKTHVVDSNCSHADSLDPMVDIFSNTFTLIGNCRCPFYTSAEMAKERFDSGILINEQRVARRGWPRWDSATD